MHGVSGSACRAHRARRKVKALFAELKNQISLLRLGLRRMRFVREQFYLAATAPSLKRLVRFHSKAPSPPAAATALWRDIRKPKRAGVKLKKVWVCDGDACHLSRKSRCWP